MRLDTFLTFLKFMFASNCLKLFFICVFLIYLTLSWTGLLTLLILKDSKNLIQNLKEALPHQTNAAYLHI